MKCRLRHPDRVESTIEFLKTLELKTETLKGTIYALEWSLINPIDDIIEKHKEAEIELKQRLNL